MATKCSKNFEATSSYAGIVVGQFDGHREHHQAVRRHPRGAVGLQQQHARRQRLRAIEQADVVHSQKPAAEQIAAGVIFAIHPPGEIDQQFLKAAGEKQAIALPFGAAHFVQPPNGPGVDRRIHVATAQIRRPATDRWGACTIRARTAPLDPSRIPCRPCPMPPGETLNPRRRTRDIPICRASKSHRDCAADVQSLLRPVMPLGRRRGLFRIAFEPIFDDVFDRTVCSRADRRTLGEQVRCSAAERSAGMCIGVVFVGFGAAVGEDLIERFLVEGGGEFLGGRRWDGRLPWVVR